MGGLPSDVTNDEIKEFFGKWGVIVNLEVPFDKMKNQRKGYCFITYESSDKVQDLFKTAKQTIKGKEVYNYNTLFGAIVLIVIFVMSRWMSKKQPLNLLILMLIQRP